MEATSTWRRFLTEAENDGDRARFDVWVLGVVFTGLCFAWWYFPPVILGHQTPEADWGTLLTVVGVLTAITLVAPFGLAYAEFDAIEERTQRVLFSLSSAYVFGALFTVTVLTSYAGMGPALGTVMIPVYWAGNLLVFSIWTSAAHSRAHVSGLAEAHGDVEGPIHDLLMNLEVTRAKNITRWLKEMWWKVDHRVLAERWETITAEVLKRISTMTESEEGREQLGEIKRKLIAVNTFLKAQSRARAFDDEATRSEREGSGALT
ncbi:MAG: hypothetical protein A3A33_01025 [Candidatus Yanofskybacteria bacterium RIFCSPLOWO2_01_FULL_49_25]|uniref:Uncharacterized protein n=1 Tax=Candidatus Yanofskybacteria bacterium RIFCSPLOWO2_01_FULL_49_25 TaxID=1802701 RepID=A0A1F8GWS5_9BACT|nr:MAG: hypothetical protein A3A33_01025 [Candidatus Yanofskybacteria bacterium RIFCSPLOWO2_01_FULL_49_25]